MLGIDWLENNNVMWDFSQSRIKIGKEYNNLRSCPAGGQWCRRAVLQGDVIVPARSEVDVPVRVVLRSLSGDVTGDSSRHVGWSAEPTSVSTGVHVSRTIIPGDRLVDIPVRVLNVQKEPGTLKEGTSIASLQQVIGPAAAREIAAHTATSAAVRQDVVKTRDAGDIRGLEKPLVIHAPSDVEDSTPPVAKSKVCCGGQKEAASGSQARG